MDHLDPVDLTRALVAIESVNPALVPGGAGEAAIAHFCAAWFAAHGFEVHRLMSGTGRPSIVGVLRGTGGGRSLMLNGHIDTVTLAGFDDDPLASRIVDGRMIGRGAYDMKSGVAAMMVAAVRARAEPLRGDILVCCVADEEHASLGTAFVLRHFTADAGIVTEPMNLEPTCWHKGFVWAEVVIHGRAFHGSRPDEGIDAIAKAGYFLVEVDRLATRLATEPGHSQLGPGSVHASLIAGGEEASSYPAACTITVERRTIPGETAATVEAELHTILDHLATTIPDFRYDLVVTLERHPLETDPDSDIAHCLRHAAHQVLGQAPPLRAEPFWTDASLMDRAGIPTVLFGATGAGAHSAYEWVDVESIETLTEILTHAIRDWCR
jgi:acetylornithine deacetylase